MFWGLGFKVPCFGLDGSRFKVCFRGLGQFRGFAFEENCDRTLKTKSACQKSWVVGNEN